MHATGPDAVTAPATASAASCFRTPRRVPSAAVSHVHWSYPSPSSSSSSSPSSHDTGTVNASLRVISVRRSY